MHEAIFTSASKFGGVVVARLIPGRVIQNILKSVIIGIPLWFSRLLGNHYDRLDGVRIKGPVVLVLNIVG